jgi:predicted nucleic acid-binding protein
VSDVAIRVYADTSVFGGVFDPEFARPSRAFFKQARSGRFELVTSVLVQAEIQAAPGHVQRFFNAFVQNVEIMPVSTEAVRLQQAYLAAGVVASRRLADALHVALATTLGCALIMNWNFRHIVHFQKIPLYNAVNTLQGYASIAIHSPGEVLAYGDNSESV